MPNVPPRLPVPGMPAPWFRGRVLQGLPDYCFDVAAGRTILMLFMGDASDGETTAALLQLAQIRPLLDDRKAAFFGVAADPEWIDGGRIASALPGIRYFVDTDRAIHRAFGIGGPCWLLLDRMQRVVTAFPVPATAQVFSALIDQILEDTRTVQAPVLTVPRVFEPELCRRLIELYEINGGIESGFMREVDGRTVGTIDFRHKRRADHIIADPRIRAELLARIRDKLAPMVQRAFQFEATRIERYIVARYDAELGGHFKPHRDNTTSGTAHRRFAVTINLNAEEFEGGELRFPEFGPATYRAPTGGAVVFSCSLLHEARPVLSGRRYAVLPFLYDEAAARVRETNNGRLPEGMSPYVKHRAAVA